MKIELRLNYCNVVLLRPIITVSYYDVILRCNILFFCCLYLFIFRNVNYTKATKGKEKKEKKKKRKKRVSSAAG